MQNLWWNPWPHPAIQCLEQLLLHAQISGGTASQPLAREMHQKLVELQASPIWVCDLFMPLPAPFVPAGIPSHQMGPNVTRFSVN